MIRQGDVLLIPVRSIPKGAVAAVATDGLTILAYGEATGHHHSLTAKASSLYDHEQRRYLRVSEETMLMHQEHEHILVRRGTYEVIRQREYSPEAIRHVQD